MARATGVGSPSDYIPCRTSRRIARPSRRIMRLSIRPSRRILRRSTRRMRRSCLRSVRAMRAPRAVQFRWAEGLPQQAALALTVIPMRAPPHRALPFPNPSRPRRVIVSQIRISLCWPAGQEHLIDRFTQYETLSRSLDLAPFDKPVSYDLSSSGTLPPLAASLIMTCLCSQMFIAAESSVLPV